MTEIRQSPTDHGVLKLIVRRPAVGTRELVTEARLDCAHGLEGDSWLQRGSRSTADGAANPEMQLTVMNVRVVTLLANDPQHRALAGDQLFIDLDISRENLPPGTRLRIGDAVIEITVVPHTGCAKFGHHFGAAAMKFVNSEEGQQLRLRGLNAKVVLSGTVRTGDPVKKFEGW